MQAAYINKINNFIDNAAISNFFKSYKS